MKEYNYSEKKIIVAAKKIFSNYAVDLVTIEDIAKEVGLQVSVVVYYFRSKDKLLQVLLDQAIKEFQKAKMQIDYGKYSDNVKLLMLMKLTCKYLQENSHIIFIYKSYIKTSMLKTSCDLLRSLRDEYESAFIDYANRCFHSLPELKIDPQKIYKTFWINLFQCFSTQSSSFLQNDLQTVIKDIDKNYFNGRLQNF